MATAGVLEEVAACVGAGGAVGDWCAAGVLFMGCGLTGGCSLPGTYWPMKEPSSVNWAARWDEGNGVS